MFYSSGALCEAASENDNGEKSYFEYFILIFIALNVDLFNYGNRCWQYCTTCICTICVLSHFVLTETETWVYFYLKLKEDINRLFNNYNHLEVFLQGMGKDHCSNTLCNVKGSVDSSFSSSSLLADAGIYFLLKPYSNICHKVILRYELQSGKNCSYEEKQIY